MKIYDSATIYLRRGLKNPLLKLGKSEAYKTVYDVGGLIDAYGIYEVVNATGRYTSLAVQIKGKPIAYLNELEIPNQKLRVKPPERVPWLLCTEPENYNSAEELFSEVRECIQTHLETPNPEDTRVLTAWIFHTWTIELYDFTPYLFFYGAFETGKTRALELLSHLAFRAWLVSGITEANLYRPIQNWKPTILLDESETFITKPEIAGLLNAGYKRGLIVPRQIPQPDGTYETAWFELFCPKAIAGTEDLARTTKSRAITLHMHKATRKIPIFIDKKWTLKLRNQLLKWRFDTLLREHREDREPLSEMGGALADKIGSGRLTELFLPLIQATPQSQQPKIIEYAQIINQQRELELSITEEVMVLQAILECKREGKIANRMILIKHITEKLNQQTDYQENWTNQRVGEIVGRLGFERKHTRHGNALIWSQTIINKLEKDPRYKTAFQEAEETEQTEQTPPYPENGSRSSQSSHSNDWLKTAEQLED